jgi:flagellar biosynthesis/type III secretory pathway protein FliH
MDLHKLRDDQVGQEIDQYEQEKTMPYIDSATRRGMEQGLQQGLREGKEEGLREGLLRGIALGLKLKFRAEAPQLVQEIQRITEIEKLEAIYQTIETAATPEELRRVWSEAGK